MQLVATKTKRTIKQTIWLIFCILKPPFQEHCSDCGYCCCCSSPLGGHISCAGNIIANISAIDLTIIIPAINNIPGIGHGFNCYNNFDIPAVYIPPMNGNPAANIPVIHGCTGGGCNGK